MALAAVDAADASTATLDRLGRGWTAASLLPIGVPRASVHEDDFAEAIAVAALHAGDSDSTAAFTGQLLGAAHGVAVLPPRWLECLELRDVIEQVATDLAQVCSDPVTATMIERWPADPHE